MLFRVLQHHIFSTQEFDVKQTASLCQVIKLAGRPPLITHLASPRLDFHSAEDTHPARSAPAGCSLRLARFSLTVSESRAFETASSVKAMAPSTSDFALSLWSGCMVVVLWLLLLLLSSSLLLLLQRG